MEVVIGEITYRHPIDKLSHYLLLRVEEDSPDSVKFILVKIAAVRGLVEYGRTVLTHILH
jgi:hypothetical protein